LDSTEVIVTCATNVLELKRGIGRQTGKNPALLTLLNDADIERTPLTGEMNSLPEGLRGVTVIVKSDVPKPPPLPEPSLPFPSLVRRYKLPTDQVVNANANANGVGGQVRKEMQMRMRYWHCLGVLVFVFVFVIVLFARMCHVSCHVMT
jgi:hypothetical protein